MRACLFVVIVTSIAGCGGKSKAPAPPPVVHEAAKPPPPPPPVCIKAGADMSAIGSAGVEDSGAHFCISDGTDTNQCFLMELTSGKLEKSASPGAAQAASLDDNRARVQTTATEVKVCAGADETACKTLKPTVSKGAENPIEAVANAQGTIAVVLSGDAEKGKGTAEVWDVAKGKRLTAIKYANKDFKCGHARVLGDTIYISADVCAGPAAHGALYSIKGKKLGDVGGKDFGTYGTEPVQVKDNVWAFLEENGAAIALQDVKTGKVSKTIEVGAVWAQEVAGADPKDATPPAAAKKKMPPEKAPDTTATDAPAAGEPSAPAMGNPGESALVRGAPGTLIVITGGPSPGNLGIVDVESGETKVLHANLCK
jgi:hypothetical protein